MNPAYKMWHLLPAGLLLPYVICAFQRLKPAPGLQDQGKGGPSMSLP
jgi:hypothetical protein